MERSLFWPAVNLNDGDSLTVSLTVSVASNTDADVPDFFDDMESGSSSWGVKSTGSTDWVLQDSVVSSGTNAWFANDGGSPGVANLTTAQVYGISSNSTLIFKHRYDTEETWDGGLVLISTDEGKSWSDLGNNMTSNGYNSTIYNSFPGFSGNSGGFISTSVNLSAYAGQNALIRFQMICDQYVDGNGWFIDDVMLDDLLLLIPNKALASDGNINSIGLLQYPTQVAPTCTQVLVTQATDNTVGSLRDVIQRSCFGDTVFFDPSLNGQVLTVDQGEIIIDKDLVIIGLGMNNITLDGSLRNRIFKIEPGSQVFIQDLTIINGSNIGHGGGLLNEGQLTLKNIAFENNYNDTEPRSMTNLGGANMLILENVIMKE